MLNRAACLRDTECPVGELCIHRTCAPAGGYAETCTDDQQCQYIIQGTCDHNICKSAAIVVMTPAGHCRIDEENRHYRCYDQSSGSFDELDSSTLSDEERYARCEEELTKNCGTLPPPGCDPTPELCEAYVAQMIDVRAICPSNAQSWEPPEDGGAWPSDFDNRMDCCGSIDEPTVVSYIECLNSKTFATCLAVEEAMNECAGETETDTGSTDETTTTTTTTTTTATTTDNSASTTTSDSTSGPGDSSQNMTTSGTDSSSTDPSTTSTTSTTSSSTGDTQDAKDDGCSMARTQSSSTLVALALGLCGYLRRRPWRSSSRL